MKFLGNLIYIERDSKQTHYILYLALYPSFYLKYFYLYIFNMQRSRYVTVYTKKYLHLTSSAPSSENRSTGAYLSKYNRVVFGKPLTNYPRASFAL